MSRDLKKSAFDTWIRPLRSHEEGDGCIVLEAGSSFQKEYVESHFSGPIRSVLKKLTHRDISVLFTIGRADLPVSLPSEEPVMAAAPSLVSEPFPELKRSFLDRYTFDTFITGDSNRHAFTAALNVARQPGKTYNPLFLFGKKGLGKTHLLQAIGNHIHAEKSPVIVRYASADEFGNDFAQAVQKRDFEWVIKKYRNNDVLLIDDVNLLEGKDGFQTFFLHAFNALYMSGKQIVLTSDRPPRELKDVQPRLINRWEQGLIAEIQSPDLATRQSILRTLCHRAGLSLPSHFVQYIASKIISDVRELEGAVNRLLLEHRMDGIDFSQSSIDRCLSMYFSRQSDLGDRSLKAILDKTAAYFQVPAEALVSNRKTGRLALARQVAMYLAVERRAGALVEIGREFNKKHSTVSHGHKKISASLVQDINIKNAVDSISADLNDRF
jgi:chromosomal replication initiator protein